MTDKINLESVTRAAVNREIRKVDERAEEQAQKAKETDLAAYKTELLLKVQEVGGLDVCDVIFPAPD